MCKALGVSSVTKYSIGLYTSKIREILVKLNVLYWNRKSDGQCFIRPVLVSEAIYSNISSLFDASIRLSLDFTVPVISPRLMIFR